MRCPCSRSVSSAIFRSSISNAGPSVTNSFTPTITRRCCSISHCWRAADSLIFRWSHPVSSPRTTPPTSSICLNSISLGGYVTSLVASLEDGLTCAILGVPVADLIELLGRHAGLSPDDPRRYTVTLAEPIGRMVSPLSLCPRVPMSGRFIYAGVADRLVHPREQVVRLWQHWGRPEIVWYQGGHTGFFQSRPVQRFVNAALVQSGLVDS